MTDESRYLRPTAFLDYEHPVVAEYVASATAFATDPHEMAARLYLRVRDDIRYEPYRFSLDPEAMTASSALERGDGFCVPKAVLLAAAGRAVGIPTRLGFADVRNHLATEKLLEKLGSDIFIWHGYVELLLDGQWWKATPAFNITMCEKFGVTPLEFDGRSDSIFHPYDQSGRRHMEYVVDHGTFADLPLNRLVSEYEAFYPNWGTAILGSFGDDGEKERTATSSSGTT